MYRKTYKPCYLLIIRYVVMIIFILSLNDLNVLTFYLNKTQKLCDQNTIHINIFIEFHPILSLVRWRKTWLQIIITETLETNTQVFVCVWIEFSFEQWKTIFFHFCPDNMG